MTDPILHLDYDLDKQLLLTQAEEAKLTATPYTDSRYPGRKLEDWYIGHYNSDYIQKIMNDFGVEGKPRFYWLEPFAVIPEHVDNGTTCSLNFILTDNPAPIDIGGCLYMYEQILLNTTVPHSVTNFETERVMLKISIFDKTFEDLASTIPYVRK